MDTVAVFVGLDYHDESVQVCILDREGRLLANRSCANDRQAIIDAVYGMFQGEDAQLVPEIALFDEWMKKVDPNQPVDLFSFYGWLSGRLFVEEAEKVGPQLTRSKLLSTLGATGTWDAHGAVGPVNIGQKRPSDCYMVLKIHDGKFVRFMPTDKPFTCEAGGYVYL